MVPGVWRVEPDPVATLYEDHRELEEIFPRLEGEGWEEALPLLESDLNLHLGREEEVLFPLIERHIGREGGPVGVMLHEHALLRDKLAQVRESLSRGHRAEAGYVMGEILSLLREHVAKEDTVLFPLARQVLDAVEREEAVRRLGRVVELDVRPLLARGEEPFFTIMEATRSLGPEDVLLVINQFEPVPLYGVMEQRGFRHRTERGSEGEFRVFFRRQGMGSESPSSPGNTVVELDNRGLEPPQPMVRILDALDRLPPGGKVVAINDRRPLFLYPELEERGYRHETEELPDGSYRITIYKEATR